MTAILEAELQPSRRTELGKITRASFGRGGYQDAQIGLTIELGGRSWGVGDFKGYWNGKRSERSQWTEEERIKSLGGAVMFLDGLLAQAKVTSVDQLVGVPVQVTFEGDRLISWRILEEVL